jgi:two-component system, chemotaxis family, response regulator Rcp1
MSARSIEILLVEDSPGDIRLAQETLREHKIQNTLHVVNDGEDALHFLRKERQFVNAPTPDIVLLDMNLPKLDGGEVLAGMHESPELKDIPVVILGANEHDRAILKRFNLPVDCLVIKPLTLERFLDAVRCFPQLGVSIVKIASA